MAETESPDHGPRWKTLLAFGIIYFVWGSTFFAIRVGVSQVPPFLLASMRFLAAGLLVFGWAAARGERRPLGGSGFQHRCWRFSSLPLTTDFCSGLSSACLQVSQPSFLPPFPPSWRSLKFSFYAPRNSLSGWPWRCWRESRESRTHEQFHRSGRPWKTGRNAH